MSEVVPAVVLGGHTERRKLLQAGMLIASIAAYIAARCYLEFLLGGNGIMPSEAFRFHRVDPIFGIDIGFYVFNLPNVWIAWRFLFWAAFAMLCVAIGC